MTHLSAPWLPILVSAALVFVAGSVIHMASPWHKNDYRKAPNEDGVMDALTAFVGYALALWQMSIWYRRAWSTTIRATVDGLIYACLTGGVFAWLWPR
jgi:O-antigen ligase